LNHAVNSLPAFAYKTALCWRDLVRCYSPCWLGSLWNIPAV